MLYNVAEDTTFIKRLLAVDERWIYEYDVEIVQKSNEWRSKMSRNRHNLNSLKVL